MLNSLAAVAALIALVAATGCGRAASERSRRITSSWQISIHNTGTAPCFVGSTLDVGLLYRGAGQVEAFAATDPR